MFKNWVWRRKETWAWMARHEQQPLLEYNGKASNAGRHAQVPLPSGFGLHGAMAAALRWASIARIQALRSFLALAPWETKRRHTQFLNTPL